MDLIDPREGGEWGSLGPHLKGGKLGTLDLDLKGRKLGQKMRCQRKGRG